MRSIETPDPPHPAGGSGTCWIRNRVAGSWTHGILTCRHVVEAYGMGAAVPLTPSVSFSYPTSATVADIDECTLDAAVLDIDPSDWPLGARPMSIPAVAPADTVTIAGRFTTASGTVLRVFQHPPYFGNLFGQRLIVDCTGVAGDSGTLVKHVATSGAAGLYMGRDSRRRRRPKTESFRTCSRRASTSRLTRTREPLGGEHNV